MGRKLAILLCVSPVTATDCAAAERPRIDLSGAWEFKLDPLDVGRSERWFEDQCRSSEIHVPGSWNAQGVGFESRGPTSTLRGSASGRTEVVEQARHPRYATGVGPALPRLSRPGLVSQAGDDSGRLEGTNTLAHLRRRASRCGGLGQREAGGHAAVISHAAPDRSLSVSVGARRATRSPSSCAWTRAQCAMSIR